MLTQQNILDALRSVHYPGYSRDVVSFGLVRNIAVNGGAVSVSFQLNGGNADIARQIKEAAEAVLRGVKGVEQLHVEVVAPAGAQAPAQAQTTLNQKSGVPGVRRIIAVASGKGGVGKSTVAVNLACALTKLGQQIGIMDADIYGPSVPKMMGTTSRPTITDEKLDPVENFGLKMMSMALLLDNDSPVIWRGPMIMKAIQQFSLAVNWGELDVLLVDLPPGTGDAQLSLAQTIALDGGVIVTTPQDVALEVARRGIAMFEKVNVKILGIIENMSYYVCPHCGKHDDVFGHGGGKQEAARLEVPFLGEIPLFSDIRICGDKGLPIVVAAPDSEPAKAFTKCAESVLKQLA